MTAVHFLLIVSTVAVGSIVGTVIGIVLGEATVARKNKREAQHHE